MEFLIFMCNKNFLSFFLYFFLLFSINAYCEDSTNAAINTEIEIADTNESIDTSELEMGPEQTVQQEPEKALTGEDNSKDAIETNVVEEKKDLSLDLSSKPDEFKKDEQVELVKKELKNPHSNGKGFLIPGFILPVVSGACWGVSYLIETTVDDDWISRSERLKINLFQITGTVMGSAAIPLFTIGIVKEAKRNKWERKHQLSLLPTINLEDIGAGLNVALEF